MSRFGVAQSGDGRPKKPLPYITTLSSGFWEGLKAGELRIQRCERCGHKQFPPKAACEECASIGLGWVKSTGHGRVYTFTVIKQVVMNSPAFESEIPYALAMIDLDEEVRIVAQVLGCPPDQVSVGMEVQAYFEDAGEGVSVPKFKPVANG